jgi:hypothetical protein
MKTPESTVRCGRATGPEWSGGEDHTGLTGAAPYEANARNFYIRPPAVSASGLLNQMMLNCHVNTEKSFPEEPAV